MTTENVNGNLYVELLAHRKLVTGFHQSDDDAVDLGSYSKLEIAFVLLTAGTGTGGATLALESAATRSGEYFAITGAAMVIDSTGTSVQVQAASFLRFVRALVGGPVGGSPVGGVSLIAKR